MEFEIAAELHMGPRVFSAALSLSRFVSSKSIHQVVASR